VSDAELQDRQPLRMAPSSIRWEAEAQVWAAAYAAAMIAGPVEVNVRTDVRRDTERRRSHRCADAADLAVYRFRERGIEVP
jgi:hypothetical protein